MINAVNPVSSLGGYNAEPRIPEEITMSDVEIAKALLILLGALILMAAGTLMMFSGFFASLKRLVTRLLLLGLFLMAAAEFIAPGWLP
jgi:hypothetical protein